MAKEDQELLGLEEIAELDAIAQGSLPNANELVTITGVSKTTIIRRGDVYKHASVMSSNNLIADLFGIDVNTLTKFFKIELKMGRAFARQKLMVRFYNLALFGSNPADRIFALKNWTAMSDNGLKEELEEVEEGVAFKIRKPVKPVEPLFRQEYREELHDSFQTRKDLAEQAEIISQNESD